MMRLPLPNLDDRIWSDLVQEGRNLIPRYAPDWTDFNLHDPGITLVELFAWIAEMDVYWLNRIPESHRRKFLRLLSVAPQPPQASRTVAQFFPKNEFDSPPNSVAFVAPATTEIETLEAGNTIRFRTLDALTLIPSQLQEVWRKDRNGSRDLTTLWENQDPLPIFGEDPRGEAIFYFGFTDPLPECETVTLYLRFAGTKSGNEERTRLLQELILAAKDCQPFDNTCQPNRCQPERPEQLMPATRILRHHSARTVWEFPQKRGDQGRVLSPEEVSWRALNPEKGEVCDETRAFTLDGFVRFKLPETIPLLKQRSSPRESYFVRCRLVSGEYDSPPVLQAVYLNAVEVEQAVPAASKFIIAEDAVIILPSGSPPDSFSRFTLAFNSSGKIKELVFLDPESQAPEFLVTQTVFPRDNRTGVFGCELRFFGEGLGEPKQKITLEPAPAQSQSVEVFTLENKVWQSWLRRPDFDASTRKDRHFTLDDTTGVVTFGDGEQGLPAPKGALIFARFRFTRAEKGNLLAGKEWSLSGSPHNESLIAAAATEKIEKITNPLPVTGGAEAETIEHAEGRALQEVGRATRAVTISDIEHLALRTPGTDIARVAAKANVDSRYPSLHAPGVITVIILSNLDRPGAQPSSQLRDAVRAYLNRRRIIGSRIEVVGPIYTKVTVKARVRAQTGADAERVRGDILQALREFFHPLRGGPEKTGWPFGRDVYRSEVLQTIDGATGVENVISMELIPNSCAPSCGNLCIGPCGLVISGEHEIVVD